MTKSQILHRIHIHPSLTWLAVFGPALVYVLSTRLNRTRAWGRHDEVGEPLSSTPSGSARITFFRNELNENEVTDETLSSAMSPSSACEELSKLLYVSSPSTACTSPSLYTDGIPINVRIVCPHGSSGLHDVVDSVWRHDSDLSRGYLLLSDSHRNGRIWRWEVGGGPIVIGKTLHLERSGCRSNLHHPCIQEDTTTTTGTNESSSSFSSLFMSVGSGGLAIDFNGKDHFAEGRLVVAEWGEGRIVRLEDNGARTPLVLEIPSSWCHNPPTSTSSGQQASGDAVTSSTMRLQRPTNLLYTPLGDLFFVDHCPSGVSALLKLPQAVHVDPLQSLAKSREAHAWTSMPPEGVGETHRVRLPEKVDLGNSVQSIGGIALTPDSTSLFVVTRQTNGRIILLKVAVTIDHDADEDEESVQSTSSLSKDVSVEIDLTPYVSQHEPFVGRIAVSQNHAFVVASQGIVLVLNVASKQVTLLGKLEIGVPITSLTLGEDLYLYMTSRSSLLRVRLQEGPGKRQTNLVPKRRSRMSL